MNQLCEKYLANLERYNQLENSLVTTDCLDDELLMSLRKIANEKHLIQKEQDAILAEFLVPFEKGERPVTQAAAKELNDFTQQLTKRFGGIDSAITYRVHLILLEYARSRSDYDEIAEQLYGCGKDEYYFNLVNLGEQKCRHFSQIWSYEDRYKDLSKTGRIFFEKCLTNHMVNFVNRDPDRLIAEGERVLQAFDRIEKEFGGMASDAKMMHISVYVNMLTAASRFREGIGETPENTRKLYHYSQLALEEVNTMKDRDVSVAMQYPGYYYAAFHAGKIDLDTLLQKLETIMVPDPKLSRYANCMRVYSNTTGYISYLYLYSRKPSDEIQRIIHEKVKSVMKYTKLLRTDGDSPVVNRFLANFIYTSFNIMPSEQATRAMFRVTLSQHKPTCIHTIVVSRLCEQILKMVLKQCPEKLAGVSGYTAQEILSHQKELIKMIRCSAVLHDVGKYDCFDIISNGSRRLEDIEFSKIKQHPSAGNNYLKESDFPAPIKDCILRHHVWHNGKGGYPADLDPTENQPLVDILSIADSLEAATDWFGRSYATPKTVSALIGEFNTQRDTRYAGFVIDVIKQPEGIRRIERILMEQRLKIVCKAWRDKDGSVVSKMVTEYMFHDSV